MRIPSLLLACLFAAPAAHADSLRCDAASGDTKASAASDLLEGTADAQLPLPLGLDASLSPASVMLVLDDSARERRVAFAGSQLTVSPDGLLLENGPASMRCRVAPDKPVSLAPPPLPEQADYLACGADIAHFTGGVPVESKRELTTLTSPLDATKPLLITGDNENVSFRVAYTSYDPFHGLDVTLTDKKTGEAVHFSGPARSLLKSFLIGITLGDRQKEARFVRLGCAWTDDATLLKR